MSKPRNLLSRVCRRIVAARWFQPTVMALIFLSAIAVGIDADPVLPAASPALGTLLRAVSWLFALELVIRLCAELPRPQRFFRSPWNVFDLVVVVMCLLPGASKVTLVLRLGRVLRVLRVVTAVPGLRIIVSAMLDSLPAVGYVGLLLVLHFYVYAVLGVALFGQNDPGHFATLASTLLTLFGVLTLEGWIDVMYTQMLGSAVHASSVPMDGALSTAQPVLGPLYFVSFILLGTIVIMNLFIGVVINSIQEAHAEAQRHPPPENSLISLAPQPQPQPALAAAPADLAQLTEALESLAARVRAMQTPPGPRSPS